MPIKLGFIGFGIMGERLLRAALCHDARKILVTGVYDPGASTTARLQEIDPKLIVFANAQEVINASDCLHIASPPSSHLGYLQACAAANKAVLCEKPLATDIPAATAVVHDLTGRGARVGVNFPFASSFAVDQLQQCLEQGVIGRPERLDINLEFAAWPRAWQADAAGWLDRPAEGGFTREVGSHFLFLSRRLLGQLHLHTATCDYPDPQRSERAITAELTSGKISIHLIGRVGKTTQDDHNTWTLEGSGGRIRLRDWSIAEREVNGLWQPLADAMPNEKVRPLVLARQLDKVAAMTRGETTNLASLSEALEVQIIVETILHQTMQ